MNPPVAPPRHHHPATALTLLLPAAMMLALSAGVCRAPAHDLLQRHRIAQWPLVDATIVAGHATSRHFPAGRRTPASDAWCASWDYDYAWQGAHHGSSVHDDSPSPFADGCFAYEGGARQALARRAIGSVVRVRVDPARPDESTPDPPAVPTGDVLQVAAGLVPLAVALWMLTGMVRLARELHARRQKATS